jgi:Predicted membrane protein
MQKGQKKMDAKVTGIVSYISWVGWLVAFLAGDKEGAKFHLNQSLVLMIGMTVLPIVSAVVGFIPVVGFIVMLVAGLCSLVLLAFWIVGLVGAIKGEEKSVPIIGNIQLLK